MNRTALVLAAHGSHGDPDVNRMVRAYAERITALELFDEVSPAFHQGDPSFSAVLDRLNATRVVVVPLMTSAGYYSEIVLPRELRRNDRFRAVDVNQTEPVGTHRDVPSLLWDRVAGRCDEAGFAPGDTTAIVVGHGTKRFARSRETTLCLVDRLAAEHPTCEFLGAFLDDDPSVQSSLTRATRRNVVVEPFLIADGPHSALDIPARLGLDVSHRSETPLHPPLTRGEAAETPRFSLAREEADDSPSIHQQRSATHASINTNPPTVAHVEGRAVVCDAAFGTDPRVIDLILDLAVCTDGDNGALRSAAGLYANHRKDAACVR